MAKVTEIDIRIAHHKLAAEKLRAAYIALVDGGVSAYTIGSRSLTKFDLETISQEIAMHEKKLDELEAMKAGASRRRAVGVVPRDW